MSTRALRIGILAADESYEATRRRLRTGIGDRDAPREDHLGHSLLRQEKTGDAVRAVLEAEGHRTLSVNVDDGFLRHLQDAHVDLVFNTYFGPACRQDQASIASFMEYARIPFSGGDAASHFIGLSKPRTKKMLQLAGLPTPGFFLAEGPDDAVESHRVGAFGFPLIVKAPAEGEGIGLDERSVVRSGIELAEAVKRVTSTFGPPALVEEFMPGREFTVGLLDGDPPTVLPVLEIGVTAGAIFSYGAKAGEGIEEICPAALPAAEVAVLGSLALQAGRLIGCRDFWRVDFRADSSGSLRILEINTLPGLQPDYSDMVKMAGPAGLGYAGVVISILRSSLRRRRT